MRTYNYLVQVHLGGGFWVTQDRFSDHAKAMKRECLLQWQKYETRLVCEPMTH